LFDYFPFRLRKGAARSSFALGQQGVTKGQPRELTSNTYL